MALFEATQLHKRFGDNVVLESISLSFEEGQLAGIMGPNGAGKTTCFNVLTGRYKPDRGTVTFAGENITGLSPREIACKGVSRSFQIDGPAIVGVMGANGAGKTTMFELITGSNLPTDGRVLVAGQDIHRVRYKERDRLALHYHQSYQVRSFTRTHPAFMLERAASARAQVHLFDEPQFNTQDGYIGFMLDFFRRLRSEGRLVFLCLHPNEPVHLDIFNEVCDRYLFVHKDESRVSRVMQAGSLNQLARDARVRTYLGQLAPLADQAA